MVTKTSTDKVRFLQLVSIRDKCVKIAKVIEGVKQSIVMLELASQDDLEEVKVTLGMGVRRLGKWSIGWSSAQTGHFYVLNMTHTQYHTSKNRYSSTDGKRCPVQHQISKIESLYRQKKHPPQLECLCVGEGVKSVSLSV